MIVLNVPYSEKDAAKAIGAKWYPALKKWTIPNNKYNDIDQFKKWLNLKNDAQYFIAVGKKYIVESYTKCWRCNEKIKAVSFATNKINDCEPNSFYFISNLEFISQEVRGIMESSYKNYFEDYSKTEKRHYFMNHCPSCNSKQGDFFQYSDFGGAFFITEEEDLDKMTIYEIETNGDIAFQGNFSWDSACEEFCSHDRLKVQKWRDIK